MKINLLCETLEILLFVAALQLCDKSYFSLGNLSSMKFCKITFENSYIVTGQGLNMSFWKDVERLRNAIKVIEKDHTFSNLVLNRCFFSNSRNHSWKEIASLANLTSLKLLNSQINLNEVGLNEFKNLKRLTMQNTTTSYLSAKTFSSTPNLQKLFIKSNENLKWVEEGFVETTNLKFLQIQGMNLNQSETKAFFRNLTGSDAATHKLDWPQDFGNLTKSLLENFRNLNLLTLGNPNIVRLEKRMIAGKKDIKVLYLDRNKIGLPEENCRMVAKNISKMSSNGNDLTCNCSMRWLQIFIEKYGNDSFENYQKIICELAQREGFWFVEICFDNSTKTIKQANNTKEFSVTNINPKYVEINIFSRINHETAFFWYIKFFNASSPIYNGHNISENKFLNPNSRYLSSMHSPQQLDCQSLNTEPPDENQTWLTKKWISLSITLIVVIFLLGAITGAFIVYLSVHKNPSLIRGSKRVIEVKRHDKAQMLIMPRGYENSFENDNVVTSLLESRRNLQPSTLSLSTDTLSTVSYISANQPTQLEIFTYRLNKLREIFQNNNNLPPPIPSYPPQGSSTSRQRIPPNVDLLFEYEWYTITTTTTQV